ncbi:MAG: hypothetical protein PVH88_01875 [Ignavibacteria bacterium]|jgi:hypothetical protein
MSNFHIRLGYEKGTGMEVKIQPSHLIVTGVTQMSGKTTTLEAILSRFEGFQDGRVPTKILFKTKPGEKNLANFHLIKPYFNERADYTFIKNLLEAFSKERISIEKGTLMKLCKDADNLESISQKIKTELEKGKRGIYEEIYTRLDHYIDDLVNVLNTIEISTDLKIRMANVINIMDLEGIKNGAIQSLFIESTIREILDNFQSTIVVIPEAWKFIPQKYSNPCKRTVESFIRQGAALNNFVFLDSQDITGVDKTILKSVSTWILGYQSEKNEVKHTLEQLPVPKSNKPKEEDIMTLKKGEFFLVTPGEVRKVYVQPVWLPDIVAKEVAMGEKVSERELLKYSNDFYVKILNQSVNYISYDELKKNENQDNMNISKIFGSMGYSTKFFKDTLNQIERIINEAKEIKINIVTKAEETNHSTEIDFSKIEKVILPLIEQKLKQPRITAAPLDVIRDEFLKNGKDYILGIVNTLNNDEKKILKYFEVSSKDIAANEITTKCLLLSAGGQNHNNTTKMLSNLVSKRLLTKTPGNRFRKNLKTLIEDYLQNHTIDDEQIELLYNHIITDLLDDPGTNKQQSY